MKRQLIAAVVCLLVSVPAWGQEKPEQLCGDYTVGQWFKLSKEAKAAACAAENQRLKDKAEPQSAEAAQSAESALLIPPAPPQYRSRGLAITGIVMAVVGLGVITPHGDSYTVLGSEYCVTEYSVDYGSCNKGPTEAQVGLILIGAGVTLAFIGAQKVNVSPMIGHGVKGASATIRWK